MRILANLESRERSRWSGCFELFSPRRGFKVTATFLCREGENGGWGIEEKKIRERGRDREEEEEKEKEKDRVRKREGGEGRVTTHTPRHTYQLTPRRSVGRHTGLAPLDSNSEPLNPQTLN